MRQVGESPRFLYAFGTSRRTSLRRQAGQDRATHVGDLSQIQDMHWPPDSIIEDPVVTFRSPSTSTQRMIAASGLMPLPDLIRDSACFVPIQPPRLAMHGDDLAMVSRVRPLAQVLAGRVPAHGGCLPPVWVPLPDSPPALPGMVVPGSLLDA